MVLVHTAKQIRYNLKNWAVRDIFVDLKIVFTEGSSETIRHAIELSKLNPLWLIRVMFLHSRNFIEKKKSPNNVIAWIDENSNDDNNNTTTTTTPATATAMNDDHHNYLQPRFLQPILLVYLMLSSLCEAMSTVAGLACTRKSMAWRYASSVPCLVGKMGLTTPRRSARAFSSSR
eukprot:m.223915 g.223915  ORF g.223915 m.223915 type:complete len:175 (+) comp15145_c0_seq2:321-845(+)